VTHLKVTGILKVVRLSPIARAINLLARVLAGRFGLDSTIWSCVCEGGANVMIRGVTIRSGEYLAADGVCELDDDAPARLEVQQLSDGNVVGGSSFFFETRQATPRASDDERIETPEEERYAPSWVSYLREHEPSSIHLK